GHEQIFERIQFPEEALNKGYVQFEWRYYYTGVGTSGPRSKLRLDNVTVHAIPYSEAWVIH
ncbi:MAG: hypothetical protein JJU11_13805, partial [Candidatus Sumerlaeia bacterium]|nr:hypothetical protein [Candidatus Sumerlaeia bacterium]